MPKHLNYKNADTCTNGNKILKLTSSSTFCPALVTTVEGPGALGGNTKSMMHTKIWKQEM